MALPTTSQLSNQMMNESVREIPTSPMDGNVTRPMIISDLLKAMKDVNFNQLVEEYGSMAGVRDTKVTPMTNALMAEREKIPATPLQTETTDKSVPAPVVDEIVEKIDVPTPMLDAKENATLSPTGTITEQNTGLMSNTTQQIA